MAIRIYLFKRSSSRNWQMKWIDHKGKDKRCSTGTHLKAKAKEIAYQKQCELDSDELSERLGWASFKERYQEEHLSTTSVANRDKWRSVARKFEALINPEMVNHLDSRDFARFAKLMRDDGRAETTIASYLTYLQAALNWASKRQIGILKEAPLIPIPRIDDDDAVAGRPLVMEEFERMLDNAHAGFPGHEHEARQLLIGLWLSGLRIGEAMQLAWDGDDSMINVVQGEYFKFSIPAKRQKKRRRQLLPMTPDFKAFLLKFEKKTGLVFRPKRIDGTRHNRIDTVSGRIADIGRAAGVIVKFDSNTGEKSFASAHDLRRTFGLRWAMKGVSAIQLQRLMRHSSITTTQKYYAIIEADDLAADLEKYADTELPKSRKEPERFTQRVS